MDGFSSSKFTGALYPEAYASGGLIGAGPIIDCKGFTHAVFILNVGDSSGTYTFQIEEDDIIGHGTPDDVAGATVAVTISSDNTMYVVTCDLQKRQRFLRVKDNAVAVGAVDLAATCMLTNADNSVNYATVPTASV
tara:strand:+ start:7796 stop:8203 length:408 start_codon:yes stop_codon:yes gene_type:complete